MSRRDNARTDESTFSLAESIQELALSTLNLVNDYLSPEELATTKSENILGRMLSTNSYISTTSTLAGTYNDAKRGASSQSYVQIGKGQCGTVYSLLGSNEVVKIPNSSEQTPKLWNDFKHHQGVYSAVEEATRTLKIGIDVPKVISWEKPTSRIFWANMNFLGPNEVINERYAIISQRVFPIPYPVRAALVDALCPKAVQARKTQFLAMADNKDCLIRVYLGRRYLTKEKTKLANVTLRNFPLHVNEMENLKLDTISFAQSMAATLAVLHWKAGVNGDDVEFILGSAPRAKIPTHDELDKMTMDDMLSGEDLDFGHRSIGLWLIDFNNCARFEDDAEGLKSIVDAFLWNDPYFPRPNSTNENDYALWKAFRHRYLMVSAIFTESSTPQKFVEAIEDKGRQGAASGVAGLFG